MKQGHLIFAQNSDVDYIRQAYTLALTIKKYNKINDVCLVTNDNVPENYKSAFDSIVNIPFGDRSKKSVWKIENRWQLIYASPFDETLVYDSDMLLLESNDNWWKFLEDKDLYFTSQVKDYRGNVIDNDSLRKSFTANSLPNIYFGLHYFKKNAKSFEFYKWLECITKNYEEFYKKYTPKNKQNFCSMDVSSAIAIKLLGDYSLFSNCSPLSFVHMKKELQGWKQIPLEWHKILLINYTDAGKLYLSNNLQKGVFHYTEDNFLTDDIIRTIENL
jgi:hypothetical protein